ncbi:SRPBCC family protein [Gramella jeungdoensis]|uniref:SRPBCC family protein n=1 Tax=Gramella jeungdoensis TaxID=708091 RepID=A0ABT0Z2C3_9FLAO|nr:SRPBCC family protein [Gramella jeungdoensis]MCM8569886.1 SRPBCC family protein [Gramella jeungdoensis]
MEEKSKTTLSVETEVKLPAEKVWEYWNKPQHITMWNFASDEWHCPRAENDLRPGGKIMSRMEAKDGSMGFDYSGTYEEVKPFESIIYSLDDGRKVKIEFSPFENGTKITESFEAEGTHSLEQQRNGWQTILDNFRKYAEAQR